ncbi:MAG: GNAT family N-acetyltransferase [Chthoniobacteraceae bacterium]
MNIRSITTLDRDWAAELVAEHFGTPEIISRGVRHDTRLLPGLIVEVETEKIGLVHYHILETRCEVVALIVTRPRQGYGRCLLEELASFARAKGCHCLWLITTNDNRFAQRFYENLGWRRVAVHRGAVAAARLLKPEISLCAADGTPIEDEIEYEHELPVSDHPPHA